jgi:sterol desaturase/sphingolipid hydroxylase (fatty acid hydroxylase superfamily)
MLLLKLLLAVATGGLITTFMGYLVHWVFHQPWSLWFYNAHMNHHKIQYPPTDFFSDTYKSAGRDSTAVLFVIAFAPIMLAIIAMTFLGILSLPVGLTTLASLIGWGLVHDHLHDQFHLTNSRWNKLPFFETLRKIHYVHHLDMRLNFGIFFFVWDKMFKTYDDANEINLDR